MVTIKATIGNKTQHTTSTDKVTIGMQASDNVAIAVLKNDSKTNTNVTQGGYIQAGQSSSLTVTKGLPDTFESVSKNIRDWNVQYNFDANGDLQTAVYTRDGLVITKTFTYDANGDLEKITLTGDLPNGIQETEKTFTYDAQGVLVSVAYN